MVKRKTWKVITISTRVKEPKGPSSARRKNQRRKRVTSCLMSVLDGQDRKVIIQEGSTGKSGVLKSVNGGHTRNAIERNQGK